MVGSESPLMSTARAFQDPSSFGDCTLLTTANHATRVRELAVEMQPTGALQPHPRNARTHSLKQIKAIADSITAFGFTNPVLVDNQGRILAGHGRWEAAKLLALADVPV